MPAPGGPSPGSARRFRIGAVLWGVFLLTLTSWPNPPRVPVVGGIPGFDKLVHFTLYAVEAWLLYRSANWRGRPGFSIGRALAIVGVMAVWGVADEVHQRWIAGRSMEGEDVVADAAGAAVGAFVASWRSRQGRGSGSGADPSRRSGWHGARRRAQGQIPRCSG